ncbi:E3 ubiquitin-protein ligase RDUF2 (RING and DUF1117 domain-containing protein 2) (AtRDUF2) (RING-type E3 ubiquitin transferase RDUF2) [Durusdinium trenchii]|uniref:E3 ubiquitin-protein ligase RDUF2 (RING and DUF1117 domain-containing protein 2) (AtRDUF2) (RING-type E3 ubiquitin transferase RDUF2) n=1 Tax=Durusdinium trenchii TaxID=1381693 RepID=A0ABP0JVL5_9DINO
MADTPKEVDIAKLKQELKSKKTFIKACEALVKLCGDEETAKSLEEVGKTAFTVLQTRFSNPKFWQAGLELFLALDWHNVSTEVSRWRDAAMEEVDEDVREKAKEQAKLRRFEEDRKHNKGQFGDAVTPVTLAELLAAQGMILVDEGDSRPGMSRDARAELRVKTVLEEDICVVCQEAMPAGSKAKAMPCGHLFHDDCLITWVEKSNSCPTCRFDDLPSERKHLEDVHLAVAKSQAASSGLYS